MNAMSDACRDVESSLEQGEPDLEILASLLDSTTRKALEAKLAFDEHVAKHGCSA
jgi:hypothetical protein